MKRYAKFFQLSTGYVEGSTPPRFNGPREPVPACGSDSVAYIDGRYGMARAVTEARETCKARGYIGFTINADAFPKESRILRPLELIGE